MDYDLSQYFNYDPQQAQQQPQQRGGTYLTPEQASALSYAPQRNALLDQEMRHAEQLREGPGGQATGAGAGLSSFGNLFRGIRANQKYEGASKSKRDFQSWAEQAQAYALAMQQEELAKEAQAAQRSLQESQRMATQQVQAPTPFAF
jgi:hypothetical protein